MRRALLWPLAITLVCGACAHNGVPAGQRPSFTIETDAAIDLAEDRDLALVRSRLSAMAKDDPERSATRAALAAEYARRLSRALEAGPTQVAFDQLADLMRLWDAEDLRTPAVVTQHLAPHLAVLKATRAQFARAGMDKEAALALLALVLAEPARKEQHLAELDDIFGYVDDLAVAEYGDGAQRARPIQILDDLVGIHPSDWVVDRLVRLYVERQRAVDSMFRRSGPTPGLGLAHGESLLHTTRNITRALALAGRIDETPAALETVIGIGDDRELRQRLLRALAADATAQDWAMVAARYQSPDPDRGDYAVALAIAEHAVAEFPDSPLAAFVAAESAQRLDESELAIRYYHRGLELDPSNQAAMDAVASLYLERIAIYATTERPGHAIAELDRLRELQRRARSAGHTLSPDVADGLAQVGNGLVSLGELDAATGYLEQSLAVRENLAALESLATMALKRDRFERAAALFGRATQGESDSPGDKFQRAKLLRLLGESHAGAGDDKLARATFKRALQMWVALRLEVELPAPYESEALIEMGKLIWWLGDREEALARFEAAVDANPDGASGYADIVSFLIVRGEYQSALDAYHRALGVTGFGDYFKVYMSLWVVAEARRKKVAPDPIAVAFLAKRDGPLWHHALAQYAGGRLELPALEARATTRGRQAELLYYTAVLGQDVGKDSSRAIELLRGVVGTDMVLFFEYDMAKHWLRNGLDRSNQ